MPAILRDYSAFGSAWCDLHIVGRPPIGRRKRDAPEIRCGSIKFERDVKSFRHLARDPRHFARDTLFRAAVLENQPRIAGKALAKHNQRAVIADAECHCLEAHRLSLQCNMNACSHAQENPVAAAALFSGNDFLDRRGSRLRRRDMQRLRGMFHRRRHGVAFQRRAWSFRRDP